MPFPSLIMGLIAKERLKIPNGLTIVQRDYPIGAHTLTRSIAHIKGSKTGVYTIPQDCVEDEGGDTEEEIARFTSIPETSAQPSSSAPARGPDKLIASWIEWTRCSPCWTPMCSTPQPSFLTSRDKSLHCIHRSTTCPWRGDQIQSLISSSLFGHSGQRGGDNFEGELAHLRGSRALT